VHPVAVRAIEATELDAVRQSSHPGFNKAVPPERAAATGTGCRFLPGIGRAETGNFLDGYGDKQYQLLNSFQEGLVPDWRGDGALAKAPSPTHVGD
jgi:hypothetical protein